MNTIANRMSVRRFILVASLACAFTLTCTSASASAHPALHDYALLLGDNLPHLLRNIMQLGAELKLSDEQKQAVAAIAQETQPQMQPRFLAAQQLERRIATEVVEHGATAAQVAEQLDELARRKRELTVLQIAALNRLRQTLTPEQYRRVLTAANWQATH
jgi:Spy/CpxP family protein refolding chaperone